MFDPRPSILDSALCIINPAAGAGRASVQWTRFLATLPPGALPINHVFTTAPGDALRLARAAAARCQVLIAVGGDGTVFEVASGLIAAESTATALAVLPCGTGNDFAESIGIRTEADARAALTGGKTRLVDAIRIEYRFQEKAAVRHALTVAGVGLLAESLNQTTRAMKRLLGQRAAYRVGLLRALWRFTPSSMRVTCDGHVSEKRFLVVCASNGEKAGGGIKLAPGARVDDGRLSVNLVEQMGRFEALRQLRRLDQGRHTTHPKVRYLTASSLAVESDSVLEVAADGELIGHTPARFDIRPKALQVLVP